MFCVSTFNSWLISKSLTFFYSVVLRSNFVVWLSRTTWNSLLLDTRLGWMHRILKPLTTPGNIVQMVKLEQKRHGKVDWRSRWYNMVIKITHRKQPYLSGTNSIDNVRMDTVSTRLGRQKPNRRSWRLYRTVLRIGK